MKLIKNKYCPQTSIGPNPWQIMKTKDSPGELDKNINLWTF